MSSSIVRSVVIALVTLSSAVLVQAQTQASSKNIKVASISGKVTVKGKGLAGIGVALRKPDYNPFDVLPRATTDQDGNYKITSISPGSYNIYISALAYVLADASDQTRVFGPARNLVIGDGENIENMNFSLIKGGVITGKITDPEGRPAVQQLVKLFRAEQPDANPQQPNRQIYAISSANTDDRGIYRMFGLVAGRYKVAVGRVDEIASSSNMADRTPYKQVYYPDATESAKASIIEVSEGSETGNIDITLGRALETFRASGRVVNGEEPVGNIRFTLVRLIGERKEYLNAATASNGRGEFTVEGLVPGKYTVFLFNQPNNELHAEDTTFDIVDSDVSGITIRLVKGGSISGAVVVEGDDKQAMSKLTQWHVQAFVQNPQTRVGTSASSTIGPDGSFRLGGLGGGTVNIQLEPVFELDTRNSFMVMRVERDGIVQSRGIEIKDGEQLGGIRLVVASATATLRGVVNVENGTLPPNSRILLRISKPGESSLPIRPPTVDERGHFIAEGLPAGSYEVVVMVSNMNLKDKQPPKQTVVLQDNSVTDISFTIDLSDLPKP